MKETHYDALVVGAGFGGIYQLYKFLRAGLSVKVIDAAGDVGGTWYWNRYPGAMSDTESYLYRYSWDKDDLLQYPWKEHYVKQPEALAYLEHVVERHHLRQYMQFNIELTRASYDEDHDFWLVECSTGDHFRVRNRPRSCDLKGKRVGVIGNGSTGVQVITAIAKDVKQLTCFQRTPQYTVPSGDCPVSAEYRESVNARYDQIWDQVRHSVVAFGFEESRVPTMSVTPAERERVFEAAWQRGNGFRFMFWTFSDLTVDETANEEACKFIRNKIDQIVQNPEKARKLKPRDFYARRPLCDAGYYEQFNRPNVDIVSLRETPIQSMTATGVATADGVHHALDVLILATGFDAVDGNYTRVAIQGRGGISLRDHWKNQGGPTSYLGVSVSGFPNMFMITGPNGPFTNIPPTLETQVEFIAEIVSWAERNKKPVPPDAPLALDRPSGESTHTQRAPGATRPVIEALASAEDGWAELCQQACANSLFKRTDSWVFGANIPGKQHAVRFYFGGLGAYRQKLE